MDCEKCRIDRYKELLKRRSVKIRAQAETIHELIKENRGVQTVKERQDWLISEYDLEVKRLTAENEQLKEELRQIFHENEMLWRYRMGNGTSDAHCHKAEREELEARPDEALDMLDVLTKVLKVLVEKEEKNARDLQGLRRGPEGRMAEGEDSVPLHGPGERAPWPDDRCIAGERPLAV